MEAPAVDLQTNQGPDADVIVDRKDMLLKGSLDLTKRELLAFSGAASRLVVGGGENALAASELKASELRPPTKVSERALPAEQGSCSGGLVVDLWLL